MSDAQKETMNIDDPTATLKRTHRNVIVDPDDKTEIVAAKKARIELDEEKKVKVLKFLLKCYEDIHKTQWAEVDASHKNISLAAQITNVMFTTFSLLRQEAVGTLGSFAQKASKGNLSVTSMGMNYVVGRDACKTIMKAAAAEFGLEFKKFGDKDKDNWYGTCLPYLDFFLGYGLRINELRLGHSTMPVAKSEGKTEMFPVIKYGINGSHHVLLEGASYPPEKKSAMAQSVGPLTALVMHIRTDKKYRDKWTAAAKRSMAHVPMIDEILEVTAGKKASEISSLIGTLAILLVTTSRQAHRMFFPINCLYIVCNLPVGPTGFILSDKGTPTVYWRTTFVA